MLYKDLTINIENGLRSRGAAMFVSVAGKFESQILIMGVLSLGVQEGEVITIVANGKDEKEAVEALERLANTGVLEEA